MSNMSNDVKLPALGESVTEGTVTRWLKNVGDTVEIDEPLLEVSTDKVDTEIPSPFAGTLTEILVQEDEDAEVGTVLARIGESAPAETAPAESAATESAPAETAPAETAATGGASAATPTPAAEVASEPESAPEQSSPPAQAPAASVGQDVKLPALGESVTEGTVTRWLKNVGDTVEIDEPLLEVSTDKVDTEIPSPFAGTLTEILVQEDEDAEVGAVLGRIGDGSATPAAPAAQESAPPEPAPAQPAPEPTPAHDEPEAPAADITSAPAEQKAAPEPQSAPDPDATKHPSSSREPANDSGTASVPASSVSGASQSAGSSNGSGYVTPIVRKLASERGVDLDSVTGTGVGGRIRKEDVIEASAKPAPQATPASSTPASGSTETSATASAAPAELVVSDLRGTTVKMSRIRKLTAEKMMESLHGMAQLTSVVEVDCSKVWALRAKAKDGFQEREGVKLTFLPFFTRAVAEALAEHAFLNASVDGDSIVYHESVNLSLAVDTEKGLMLPTMRGAEHLTVAEHAKAIADLAEKARTGALKSDEISGGTFAVTNTGSGGTMFDTPIVPAPQVGILATCAIVKKPVVVRGPNGEDVISIRPMCYLPLSYDHRIVDGADAARFLQAVKKRIEEGAFESEVGL